MKVAYKTGTEENEILEMAKLFIRNDQKRLLKKLNKKSPVVAGDNSKPLKNLSDVRS